MTAALLTVAPSAAAASGWTTPAVFGGTDIELTPRAAIAADGTSAVAWSTACCKKRALVVSTGRANGHFAPPRVIHRPRPNDYSVAARHGGAFLVAWGDEDGLRVAVRTATGRPIVGRRIFAPKRSEIMGVQVAPDPRGAWRQPAWHRKRRTLTPVQWRGPAERAVVDRTAVAPVRACS